MTFDLLVRISTNSSKMEPTEIKRHYCHFIFLLPPNSGHKSGTIDPTEMFTYRYLQNLIKDTIKVFWNVCIQCIYTVEEGHFKFYKVRSQQFVS